MKIFTHFTRNRKKSLRILTYVASGIIVFCIFTILIYHTIYKKNTAYFLKALKKYETSEALLAQAWPNLASKAKTSTHYLMLLKRLHAYNLQKPYEKVLIRSLWKYKELSSIVALGVDYFLQQYSIENNQIITSNAHDSVVRKELKKFLDNAIDILWDRYPNMVRLYYVITTFEDNNESTFPKSFTEDDLLSLYKKIYFNNESWNDYEKLWKLTNERVFLYLLTAYAKQAGESTVAANAYKTFLKTYTNLHISQHGFIISYLSLIMRDISMLRNIAEREISEETLLNLASAYIYTGKQNKSWKVLEKHHGRIQSHSEMWDSVYFWLASRESKFSYSEILALFQSLREKYSNLYFFAYEYWIYFYQKDTKKLDVSLFPDKFFTSSKVAFLQKEKTHRSVSPQPTHTALWRAYNSDENTQLWKHILASYFLRYALYDEFFILQEKHKNDIEMLPYEFFLSKKKQNTSIKNTLFKKFTNAIKSGNLEDVQYEFPWWHYYNVAVYYNAQMDYKNAQNALQKAEDLYRNSYHHDKYPYMPYIWMQYAYAAREKNDMATMQTFIKKIRHAESTFVYLQEFKE